MPTGCWFCRRRTTVSRASGGERDGVVKILCLLNDGPDATSSLLIETLSRDHQVEVIDLSKRQIPYDALVDKIFASDKLISW